jgi:hypothetical protein
MTSILLQSCKKAQLGHGINSQAYARSFPSTEWDAKGLQEGSGYA